MGLEGYCVKCRKKRTVKDGKVEKTAKGRSMVKGACPVCGTTVTRFLVVEPGDLWRYHEQTIEVQK